MPDARATHFPPLHALSGLVLAGCALAGCAEPAEDRCLVAAASSLRELLTEGELAFRHEYPGAPIEFSFAASSTLARQIESGVPYDLFVSAGVGPVVRLREQLEPGRVLLSNRIVLVAAPGADPAVREPSDLVPWASGGRGEGRWIAVAGPQVPAGRYVRLLLDVDGLLTPLESSFVLGSNVRQTLALVESGAAAFGFVYATDQAIADTAELRWSAPEDAFPAVQYVAAAHPQADARARAFLEWLSGDAFQSLARAHGFLPPPADEAS